MPDELPLTDDGDDEEEEQEALPLEEHDESGQPGEPVPKEGGE
jgi:segregation and condensation protein B